MRTVVEAGHFYSCTGPTNVSLQGWEIGKQLAAESEQPVMALFIDDHHPEMAFLQPGEVPASDGAEATLKTGADTVFYESVFAAQSLGAALALLDAGQIKSKKGVLGVGGVRLAELSPDKDALDPTCVFMDYLLVKEKAKIGGDQIVVLPAGSYESQQAKLGIVLSRLVVPEMTSYTAKFFDNTGAVTKEMAL